MGNPIQYRNTDNPSQIQGWVSHNKGGFHKTTSVCPGGANHNAFIVMVRPPGRTQGGVNENFSPVLQNSEHFTHSRLSSIFRGSVKFSQLLG